MIECLTTFILLISYLILYYELMLSATTSYSSTWRTWHGYWLASNFLGAISFREPCAVVLGEVQLIFEQQQQLQTQFTTWSATSYSLLATTPIWSTAAASGHSVFSLPFTFHFPALYNSPLVVSLLFFALCILDKHAYIHDSLCLHGCFLWWIDS